MTYLILMINFFLPFKTQVIPPEQLPLLYLTDLLPRSHCCEFHMPLLLYCFRFFFTCLAPPLIEATSWGCFLFYWYLPVYLISGREVSTQLISFNEGEPPDPYDYSSVIATWYYIWFTYFRDGMLDDSYAVTWHDFSNLAGGMHTTPRDL